MDIKREKEKIREALNIINESLSKDDIDNAEKEELYYGSIKNRYTKKKTRTNK